MRDDPDQSPSVGRRPKPVREAATEVETLAIEARELLDRLKIDGLAIAIDLFGIKDAVQFRVQLPNSKTRGVP